MEVIVFAWLGFHLLLSISFLIKRSLYVVFLPVVLVSEIFVYLYKPITYDLLFYLNYFTNPGSYYEPLFFIFSYILSNFYDGSFTYTALSFIVILLYALALKNFNLNLFNIIISLPILPSSIYFLLGSQNVIRQFISSSILIVLMSFLFLSSKSNISFPKRFIIFVLLLILSTGFHKSGIYFGLILLILTIISNKKITFNNLNIKPILILLLGLSISFLLNYIDMLTVYTSKELDWGEERSDNYTKVTILLLYLVISYILYKSSSLKDSVKYVSSIRFNYGYFIVPFSFLTGELFSRLLFFFYALDVVWIILLASFGGKSLKTRTLLSLFFILNGFAPNAINILTKS